MQAKKEFAPTFRNSRWWGDADEPRSEFKERMEKQLAEQLRQYRKSPSQSLSENPLFTEQTVATRLASFVAGKTWTEIGEKLANAKPGLDNPKSYVATYSKRFAKSIGLKVQKQPPGRPPSKTSKRGG